MKTEKLTEKQQVELEEYRNEIFQQAVSTRTDKEKAERDALRLVDGVLEKPEIHWVKSPGEAKKLYVSLENSLRNSLWDSLWGSLWDSLRDSLQYSLRYSLWDSLWGSLWDSLWYSLWDSLWDSLRDSLWGSLQDSLWGSLWGSAQIAFYRFPEKIGLVKYDEEDSNLLKCYEKLLQSCFAIYVLPGHIILVEKPVKIEVKDGKLVNIQFGE